MILIVICFRSSGIDGPELYFNWRINIQIPIVFRTVRFISQTLLVHKDIGYVHVMNNIIQLSVNILYIITYSS